MGKQIREVKISPDGGLTTIINDGRYMHESPVFLEDQAMVAELQNSQKADGNHIQRLATMQRRAEDAKKENRRLREDDKPTQCEAKVLKKEVKSSQIMMSKKEDQLRKYARIV